MPVKQFKDVRPDGRISASELNRLGEITERHDRITSPNMQCRVNASGIQIDNLNPPEFYAQIQDYDAGKKSYQWQRVVEQDDGSFQLFSDGESGTTTNIPAYEINSAVVPINSIQRLKLADRQDMYFFNAGGGGSAMAMIRTTSELPASGQNGMFAGVIQTWDKTSKTFKDKDTASACLIYDPNNPPTLVVGYHLAMFVDPNGSTPIYALTVGPRFCIPIQDQNCNQQDLRLPWGSDIKATAHSPC